MTTSNTILASLQHIHERYGEIGRLLADPDPDLDRIVEAMTEASGLCSALPSPVGLSASELITVRAALERIGIRRAEIQAAVDIQRSRLAVALRDLERGGQARRLYAADVQERPELVLPQFVDRHG